MENLSRTQLTHKIAQLLSQSPRTPKKAGWDQFADQLKPVVGELFNAAFALAAQTSGDPRTRSFIDNQTRDYKEIIQFMTPHESFFDDALIMYKEDIAKYSTEDVRGLNQALQYVPKYRHMREHELYAPMSKLVQSKIDLPAGLHQLLTYSCCRMAESHYQYVHIALQQIFWDARRHACAQIGYLSEDIIPNDATLLLLPGLAQAYTQLSVDALERFQVSKSDLENAFWQPHARGWSCTLPHKMGDLASSQFLPKHAICLREEGALYSLPHQMFPKQAQQLILTPNGQLLDGWLADHAWTTIEPDQTLFSAPAQKLIVFSGQHLAPSQKLKLTHAYHMRAEECLLQRAVMPSKDWLELTLPFWNALAQVHLLTKNHIDTIVEQKKLLDVKKDANLLHQLQLFLNSYGTYPDSTRQNGTEHATRIVHRP
jgi:hypothetical protein